MRTNILHQAKIEGCGKGLKGRFDLSGGPCNQRIIYDASC
jgi:hypothetical protein